MFLYLLPSLRLSIKLFKPMVLEKGQRFTLRDGKTTLGTGVMRTFPVAVVRKRFLAPLFVFSLGISRLPSNQSAGHTIQRWNSNKAAMACPTGQAALRGGVIEGPEGGCKRG